MNSSPADSSVHGILQARILEWIAMPSSRRFFKPRDQTCVSCSSCTAGRLFIAESLAKSREGRVKHNSKSKTWMSQSTEVPINVRRKIQDNRNSKGRSGTPYYIFPGVCSNSCPLSLWCHPTISSSVIPFSSCLQSFSASGSFPMSRLFASGGQNVRASASASVLLVDKQH